MDHLLSNVLRAEIIFFSFLEVSESVPCNYAGKYFLEGLVLNGIPSILSYKACLEMVKKLKYVD